MTPAVRALLHIVEEAETSYTPQEAEKVADYACEAGMFPESRAVNGDAYRALVDRIAGTLGTSEGAYALNRRIHEEGRECPMLSPLYLVWVTALDALRAEENAARERVADRLYETDEEGVGNPFNGASILRDNGDGFTFEDVFALDALCVGDSHTYGGGAVATTTITRIK